MAQWKMPSPYDRFWSNVLPTVPPTNAVSAGEIVEADENPDPHFFELVTDPSAPLRRGATTAAKTVSADEAQEPTP